MTWQRSETSDAVDLISIPEWQSLGAGDVIDVGGTLRIVLDGPNGETPRQRRGRGVRAGCVWGGQASQYSILLSIRRRSWTGRAYTVYGYNDLRTRASIVKVSRYVYAGLMDLEAAILAEQGIDLRRELLRYRREESRWLAGSVGRVLTRSDDKCMPLGWPKMRRRDSAKKAGK